MAGCWIYDKEAVQHIVAGLAPNLRHVHIWFDTAPCEVTGAGWPPPTRPPWRGFHSDKLDGSLPVPKTKGRLESLRIASYQIAPWLTYTEFSYLQVLTLDGKIGLQGLQAIAEIAVSGELRALRALRLPDLDIRTKIEPFQADCELNLLLSTLQPLKSLSMEPPGNLSLDTAFDRHGATLHCFHVRKYALRIDQTTQLQRRCPAVTELSLEFLRKAGSHEELQIYQTLRAIPRLKKLTLSFHSSTHGPICIAHVPGEESPDGEDTDEEFKERLKLEIQNILRNTAMDETLARSIFEELMTTNHPNRADLHPTLSYIQLLNIMPKLVCGQDIAEQFNDILEWIGRQWVCERDRRDTHKDEATVEEHCYERRLRRGNWLNNNLNRAYGSKEFAGAWKTLWPGTDTDWKNGWKSIPLFDDSEA
ncbi:uncharacterized protein N0V89_010309 [Didymosphaeria variabile]|uniref:Uncharacterized protein n=1 Tax=Didymosphaeria variabile TaxID=1932322 RepID=A0A9W8XB21_9PLEO|nr:uncharacterized protein N0V89_010309 [Didymosphaeria variabile]KAJ4346380.1 hypothetical protein N0V89_010309 [Didymosphaeria variabile]